jgi:hypothetical protein
MNNEIARQIAKQAVQELMSEPPLVLMSPHHWERLTAAVANGVAEQLVYYWRDPGVRDALTGQYERRQQEYWDKHGDDAMRMRARKERDAMYRRYNVSPGGVGAQHRP